MESSLLDLSLVPASLLNFCWDPEIEADLARSGQAGQLAYLRPELKQWLCADIWKQMILMCLHICMWYYNLHILSSPHVRWWVGMIGVLMLQSPHYYKIVMRNWIKQAKSHPCSPGGGEDSQSEAHIVSRGYLKRQTRDHSKAKMDGSLKLIILSGVMLFGSYLAGSIPLFISLSEEKLQVTASYCNARVQILPCSHKDCIDISNFMYRFCVSQY